MYRTLSLGVLAIFAASCATKPENVAPLPVSTIEYGQLNCSELAQERRLTLNEVAIYTEKQRSARNRDIALNWLVLVGSGAITSDHDEALGTAKGKVQAIETVMDEKDCPMPFDVSTEADESDDDSS